MHFNCVFETRCSHPMIRSDSNVVNMCVIFAFCNSLKVPLFVNKSHNEFYTHIFERVLIESSNLERTEFERLISLSGD